MAQAGEGSSMIYNQHLLFQQIFGQLQLQQQENTNKTGNIFSHVIWHIHKQCLVSGEGKVPSFSLKQSWARGFYHLTVDRPRENLIEVT